MTNRKMKRDMGAVVEDILEELKPRREISKGRTRIIAYKRVNTSFLTKQWITNEFKRRNSREVPTIIQQGNLLIIQYKDCEPFYLSLEDGRLYHAPSKDSDLENAERQASIFLEIIRQRVEGFRMLDIYPTLRFIGEKHYGE